MEEKTEGYFLRLAAKTPLRASYLAAGMDLSIEKTSHQLLDRSHLLRLRPIGPALRALLGEGVNILDHRWAWFFVVPYEFSLPHMLAEGRFCVGTLPVLTICDKLRHQRAQ